MRQPYRVVIVVALLVLLFSLRPRVDIASGVGGPQQVSPDPYVNVTSQHLTQVEPDTFAFGSTIVSAFQTGRFTEGGGSNIGCATHPADVRVDA